MKERLQMLETERWSPSEAPGKAVEGIQQAGGLAPDGRVRGMQDSAVQELGLLPELGERSKFRGRREN